MSASVAKKARIASAPASSPPEAAPVVPESETDLSVRHSKPRLTLLPPAGVTNRARALMAEYDQQYGIGNKELRKLKERRLIKIHRLKTRAANGDAQAEADLKELRAKPLGNHRSGSTMSSTSKAALVAAVETRLTQYAKICNDVVRYSGMSMVTKPICIIAASILNNVDTVYPVSLGMLEAVQLESKANKPVSNASENEESKSSKKNNETIAKREAFRNKRMEQAQRRFEEIKSGVAVRVPRKRKLADEEAREPTDEDADEDAEVEADNDDE